MTEKMRLGRASPAGCAGETPTIPAKTNSSAEVNTLFTFHYSLKLFLHQKPQLLLQHLEFGHVETGLPGDGDRT